MAGIRGGQNQRLHYTAVFSDEQPLLRKKGFGLRSLSLREKISPANQTLIR
jgi:hypothetical protein